MKKITLVICCLMLVAGNFSVCGQSKDLFPKGTIIHNDIPYASDTLKKHLLDLYIPAKAKANMPLIIWIHGGAWMLNDKHADMGYMTGTIHEILAQGYAIASIDYRFSTHAKFPAQIQDCNQAIAFLSAHADQYKLDKEKFVVMGFSAGGHLGSLVGLSNNNDVKNFHASSQEKPFKIKAVVDFYGPSEFLLFFGNADINSTGDPISTLLGASPIRRPDLAKIASPATYVDKNDPPFIIIHGEKDDQVPVTQSVLLKSYLDLAHVKNDLVIVKGAPHFGDMFDTEEVRKKVMSFLTDNLK